MSKFSIDYESKLDMLHKINDFIHVRNKRLKTCYNPMLIAETNNANMTALKIVARDLFAKNMEKAESLQIHLLGGFMIDKTPEDDPIYTLTTIYINRLGVIVHDTNTITYPEFISAYGEEFNATIINTRRETFMGIAVVFDEAFKEEE